MAKDREKGKDSCVVGGPHPKDAHLTEHRTIFGMKYKVCDIHSGKSGRKK